MKSRVSLLFPLFVLQLLLLPAYPSGKPKVNVRIRVSDGFAQNLQQDSLSKSNSTFGGGVGGGQVFYLNVTVFSDDAAAVAQNKGQWCIKGETWLSAFDYHGTLQGNTLEIEIPQKDGKIKKKSFVIFDRKWRKESDI